MADQLHEVADLCFRLETAASITEVRECMRAAAGVFGTEFFLFGMRTGKNITPSRQVALSNYPKPWQRYYDEKNAFTFDPIIANAFVAKGPFRWDGLHKSQPQLDLRAESVRNGMLYGMTCPDRAADGSIALMSFCGGVSISPEPEQWDRTLVAHAMFTSAAHKAMTRIIAARSPAAAKESFTDAELRCLELMAATLTAEEAAERLGVSRRTVFYYLDRVAEKLGVSSRKEAVMKAVVDGIVDPRPFPTLRFGGDTQLHD